MKKEIYPAVQIRLMNDKKIFGPGPCRLLELIEETGSIQKACQRMELSYSKAMKLIKGAEKELDMVLLARKSGGTGGGGSALTPEALTLVEDYRRMEADVRAYTAQVFQQVFQRYFAEEGKDDGK